VDGHLAERLEPRTLLATFVVTNTENTGDGSLRKAIEDANNAAGADVITFNIGGLGPFVIQPRAVNPNDALTAPMPITGPVLIDGYTQATASPNTLASGDDAQIRVQIDGGLAPAGMAGLFASGAGVTIRGLSITRFEDGVILRDGGGSTIAGCFIGLDAAGNPAPNRGHGISIEASPVNTIGGTNPSDRNLISANLRDGIRLIRTATVDTLIQGNYLGTDRTGTVDMGNGIHGIEVGAFNTAEGYASRTTIGGTTAAARNLISGNNANGITLVGTAARENVIQGNYIGTNVNATAPLGNEIHGILLTFAFNGTSALSGSSSNNTIGGTAPGAGNVVSGNKNRGIVLVGTANDNTIQGNFIGTNAFGNTDVGNTRDGINLQDAAPVNVMGPQHNLIGGTTAAAGNIIAGNDRDGIQLTGATTTDNKIQHNRIGIAANNGVLGNTGHGLFIDQNASQNVIGYDGVNSDVPSTANIIANNGGDGVSVVTGRQNRISGNSIYSNAGNGIDLGNNGPTSNDANDADTGPNTLLNSPKITAFSLEPSPAGVRITGQYGGAPGVTVRVEFYRNPGTANLTFDSGKEYLGFRNYTTAADGTVPFTAVFPGNQFSLDDKFNSIAIDSNGNTSEFGTEVNLAPLEVTGNFALNPSTGMYEATGQIEIRHVGGTSPTVRVQGTVKYNQQTITATGSFEGLFGATWRSTFTGSAVGNVGDPSAKMSMLVPATCALPAELRPAALPVSFTSITFGVNEIRLAGKLDLPAGVGGFSVSVGGDNYFVVGDTGLLLSGLSVSLPKQEATFFKWLKIEATGLAIAFNAAANSLKLQGALKVKGIFPNASVTANLAGENYIEITPTGVNFRGTLAVEDIKVAEGLFGLEGMSLTLAMVDGEITEIGGSAKVKLPSGKTVEGEIGIKRVEGSLQLDSLRLTGDDLDVPIGTSGAMFQMVEVSLKDLAVGDPQPTFGGKLGFSYGPEFDIQLPAVFGGKKFDDVSLLGVELSVEGLPLNVFNFDTSELVIIASGTIKILGGVAEGTASAEFNFPEGHLKLAATFTALAGFMRANASLTADTSLNLTGSGSASLQVPAGIPVIGGVNIAGASAYLQYRNNNTFADDFIAGYGEFRWFGILFRIGAKMNFDGTAELLSASPLPPAAPAVGLVSVQAAAARAFMVSQGAGAVLLSAGWETASAGAVPFRITAPDGTVYTNADSGGGKIEVASELTNSKRLTVAVRNPAPGPWSIELTNADALGAVTFEGAAPLPLPTIRLTAPAGTQAGYLVNVSYQASDANPGAAVALFYDKDGSGFDGNTIAAGLAAGPGQLVRTWDTSGVAPGDYRVYAIVSDHSGAPAFAYAPGVVQVRAPRVTDVFVSGSRWTSAYRERLAAAGLGDAAFGFHVGAGAAQVDELPWASLDRISVRFDRPIAAELIDLAVRGLNRSHYDVANVTYDAATRTATWSLASPLPTDRVVFDLDGDAGGLSGPGAGGVLDGEWADGQAAFPSGDGTPGGDFLFGVNVLPADVNRDGKVNAFDLLPIRTRFLSSIVRPGRGASAYDVRYDLNGDGRINAMDLLPARGNQGVNLPPPPPAAPPVVHVDTLLAATRFGRRGVWQDQGADVGTESNC
jgi:hypothetical protein